MKMDPKALENPAQWSDATLERFADKVQRGRGNYITGVRVYGRTRDGTGVGGLVKILDWTREGGFFTDRESERDLARLDRVRQERQQAEEKARAEEEARREEARREEARRLEQGSVWSVAQTGYDLGDDDEDYQSYVGSVEIFDSKADAIAYAKDIGRATVVKGTQMWNEPMGQVEEHDRPAWTRYYR
jgi:hypothetical protein